MSLLRFKNLTLSLPHKTCFEDFSTRLYFGTRVGIIGPNGGGKSSLLQLIEGKKSPTSGEVVKSPDLVVACVPQLIEDAPTLSGGQRFNKALSVALTLNPDVLLLDEPTNHLDLYNRRSLMKMLNRFQGTLLIASHDTALLRACVDQLWIVDQGRIRIFKGTYDAYLQTRAQELGALQDTLESLTRDKKALHQSLMQEQQRAKKSKNRGQKSIAQHKWPTIVSNAKASRSKTTSGRKQRDIRHQRQETLEQLQSTRLPESLRPTFALQPKMKGGQALLSITDGAFGYAGKPPLITQLHFQMGATDRIALMGPNGCGKTTFLKAILGDPAVYTRGNWHIVPRDEIGYLDQHYGTLDPAKTVFETLESLCPDWPHQAIRGHLNDFLFRKNEAIDTPTRHLSGGEKARLCLAQIAAKPPRLLILDEITNNLDLETKDHVTQVIKAYPGALLVVSHEQDFMDAIGVKLFKLEAKP